MTDKKNETAKKPVAKTRMRKRFRLLAEMQNPSPFLKVLDARGRPRHKPRHTSVKAV